MSCLAEITFFFSLKKLGHGHVQREDPVEILREDSHIQAKETETKPASPVISNF